MSQITVIGNIAEPELRFTKAGKAVLTFGLAENFKVGDEKQTTWHEIKAWDELAENLAAELAKGDRVIVTGQLRSESWEDKEGGKRTKFVITAFEAGKSLRWAKGGSE